MQVTAPEPDTRRVCELPKEQADTILDTYCR